MPNYPLNGGQENVQRDVQNRRITFEVIAQALGHREPEFDKNTAKRLFMRNSRVRNWHYRRLAEGSGRATVSNSSFCWGVMADRPDADWR